MKMRYTILIWFLLVGVGSASQTLRIATLNVNAGISCPSNAIAAIRSSNADIVCLQEPNPRMMSGLTNALAESYPYSQFDSPGHNYWYYIDRLGILSKYPFDATFIAPSAEGAFGSQFAVIRVGATQVQVLNVHLAPPRLLTLKYPLHTLREFADSENKRVAEVVSMLSILDPDRPAILAGDLNAFPASPTVNTILKRRFMDTHGSDPNAPAAHTWSDTIEGIPLSARIDYIFCDSNFVLVTNGVLPCASSDHSLVYVELEMKDGTRQQPPAP